MNCFGSERIAAIENTNMFMPHVEKTAVVTGGGMGSAAGQRRGKGRTVAGNGAEARDEGNLEAAFTDTAGEAGVRDLGALHLLAAGAAAVLERIKVADLADEGAGTDDGKADPEAPDEAAEYGDDFMAKQLWSV